MTAMPPARDGIAAKVVPWRDAPALLELAAADDRADGHAVA